jgi:hypothetical protein
VAIARAETFYLPPPSAPPDAWGLVLPAERCLRWYEERQQRRLPRPSGILLGTVLYARIDAGRWVADCPCGSAQVITPADPRLACPECLAGWYQLAFPADVADAETAVAELAPHEQFWWQAEDPNPWNRPAMEAVPAGDEVAP